MEFGAHLPLIDFAGEGLSYRRLAAAVDAARDCGFSSVSANDHFLFPAPWLDGPTAVPQPDSNKAARTMMLDDLMAGMHKSLL